MSNKQEELQKAVQFVRQSMSNVKMNLDNSVDSIKYLDNLMDTEFDNKGRLRYPQGQFAKYQPIIMIGLSGYIADVIMKNTRNAKLQIDETDKHWYINFQVIAENGWIARPGQRVVKRAQYGRQTELFTYVVAAINSFRSPDPVTTQPYALEEMLVKKKPWWKFN
jgi:hypothetical protein